MEFIIGVSVLVFGAYAFIMFRYSKRVKFLARRTHTESVTTPSVSVVVALKNEKTQVVDLIRSLSEICFDGDFEIILVDDHSSDDTYALLLDTIPIGFQVLKNNGIGKKQAIETGVKHASKAWVAVTDADCLMSKHWLTALVGSRKTETKMVLGPVFIAHSNSDFLSLQKMEFLGLQGATAGSACMGSPILANGANMMFKREVFLELNPYEDNYHLKTGDDQFLMLAIHSKYPGSCTYAFDKEAIVSTFPVICFKKYWEQRVRWASKGSSYTHADILYTGLIVFLTSCIVIGSVVYGLAMGSFGLTFGFLLIKIVVDYPLVKQMAKFSNATINPVHFLISGFIYPLVVVFAVVAGFLKKP